MHSPHKSLAPPCFKMAAFLTKFRKGKVQNTTKASILNIEWSSWRENIGKFTEAIPTNNNGKISVLIFWKYLD